jgi:cobalt/nickel transport system permease protein
LGVFPAFVGYPIFKRIIGDNWSTGRVITGSIVGAEVGLLLGATGVVVETALSGVSSLPFSTFVLMMLPIHAAIGLVEGFVTAAVVLFVRQAQPEMLARTAQGKSLAGLKLKTVLVGLAIVAMVSGVAFAWFASTNPDGLEWSIARVTGSEEFAGETSAAVHEAATSIQEKTAFLPGYGFKRAETAESGGESSAKWPAVDPGTSTAGLVGAGITLLLAGIIGFVLNRRKHSGTPPSDTSAPA